MEQARHWVWTGQKDGLRVTANSHHINPSHDDSSWEEQAFAEDAAGGLGGCIWPPRSYSCTFCRREFKSAQALGGHMNIHRRDRARLKQSPINDHLHHDQVQHSNNLHNPYASLGLNFHQYPSRVCNPNPSSDNYPHGTCTTPVASPSPQSIISTNLSNPESGVEKILFPTLSSSIAEEVQDKRRSLGSPSTPKWNSDPINAEEENAPRIQEPRVAEAKLDYVESDLSVSLNLVVRTTRPIILDHEEKEEDEEDAAAARVLKRRKTEAASLPFFLRLNSVESAISSNCSLEELDLELRLGARPKVK